MIVGIIGSGTWGRALATLVAEAGNEPRMGYQGKSPGGFPGTPNIAALVREADLTLMAVDPGEVREMTRLAKPGPGARVVIAAAGLETGTGAWLSHVVTEESACLRVGALAGPCLASEVMARRPSAMVAASTFDEVSVLSQKALHSSICRLYTSRDLRGVELAGAMVQVLSVAVGVGDALQLGMGVHGVIITRGLAEATRLGLALGAEESTFAGLAGVGNLVAAGSHPEHPGYRAGRRLVTGGSHDPAAAAAAASVLALAARKGVDLPLTKAIAAIASGKLKAHLAIDMLMRREARPE